MVVSGFIVLLTLMPAAPPPQAPPPAPAAPAETVSEQEARAFAQWLMGVAQQVAGEYAKPVTAQELLVAGMTELYDVAGKKMPDSVRGRLAQGGTPEEVEHALTEARASLGQDDAVRGLRAFAIAAGGFSRATDPYCGLMYNADGSIAEADGGFGLGFLLEGVGGPRWMAYVMEVSGAWQGVLPPGEPRPPIGPRWVVRRVIPGGPASKAGLRPGDRITHLNGVAVTEGTHAQLFRQLVSIPSRQNPPAVARDVPRRLTLLVQRDEIDRPVDMALSRGPRRYIPESVFGLARRRDGRWEHMIDKESRIGYVRIGTIEDADPERMDQGTDKEFAHVLDELMRDGARGLVLDLRWCPGGYVGPTSRVAGALLPRGKVIATVQHRLPGRGGPGTYTAESPHGGAAVLDLPVLVLVNGETTGGGEMIAAALQDHGRAVIAGQRTFGKANLMSALDRPFYPLQYRVSTGYSLRPNGKPRHRFPDSKPTDAWGVKPDKGYEIPGTADLSERLRSMAERQAARGPDDSTAVDFDDPLADPQKMVAVRMLKERLAKK